MSSEDSWVINGYEITNDVIGKSPTCVVKKAIYKKDNIEVAVKIIYKNKLTNKMKKNVDQQIEVLKTIKSVDYTTTCFSVVETLNEYVIFMELYDGFDLLEFIEKFKGISEDKARFIFKDMLSAVENCHKSGVCHRDIKLENFMFDIIKQKTYLIDYGLSSFCRNKNNETILINNFCGTPYYISPEIALGSKYNGEIADIWALGVVLYAMVENNYPFYTKNKYDLYRKIICRDVRYSKCSKSLQKLLNKMLTKYPKSRATIDYIKNSEWFTNKK